MRPLRKNSGFLCSVFVQILLALNTVWAVDGDSASNAVDGDSASNDVDLDMPEWDGNGFDGLLAEESADGPPLLNDDMAAFNEVFENPNWAMNEYIRHLLEEVNEENQRLMHEAMFNNYPQNSETIDELFNSLTPTMMEYFQSYLDIMDSKDHLTLMTNQRMLDNDLPQSSRMMDDFDEFIKTFTTMMIKYLENHLDSMRAEDHRRLMNQLMSNDDNHQNARTIEDFEQLVNTPDGAIAYLQEVVEYAGESENRRLVDDTSGNDIQNPRVVDDDEIMRDEEVDHDFDDSNDELDAKDIFEWSSGNFECDRRKQDNERGLKEAMILAKRTIADIEYSISLGEIIENNERNVHFMIGSTQYWGIPWRKEKKKIYNYGKDILSDVKEVYEHILKQLRKIKSQTNKIRLVCGFPNSITTWIDPKDGKQYWHFKDFDIKVAKLEQHKTKRLLCNRADGSATYVFQTHRLIIICVPVWRNRQTTLQSMIDDQAEHLKNPEKYFAELQLDTRSTMGGVMIHMFMHVFGLASDQSLHQSDKIDGQKLPRLNKGMFRANTYHGCTALAKKDFDDGKVGKEGAAMKNAPSFEMYPMFLILNKVAWWKTAEMPKYARIRSKLNPERITTSVSATVPTTVPAIVSATVSATSQ